MTTGFETFEVEAGHASAGLLTPGRVLGALARGAGISSEEVGMVEIARHGTAAVEIARGRAVTMSTPQLLPCEEGGRPALFVLRRPDDPPEAGRAELLLSVEEGEPPRPGEAALALADALGIGQEELGFGLQGAGFLRVSVPLGVVANPLPSHLGIGGKRYKVENLAKKA
jgi:hypothetical protein